MDVNYYILYLRPKNRRREIASIQSVFYLHPKNRMRYRCYNASNLAPHINKVIIKTRRRIYQSSYTFIDCIAKLYKCSLTFIYVYIYIYHIYKNISLF